ncbi:MAG: hypothetical protein FWB99_00165 [Treponema sp.]|nr:hypothetical protein [Treponema sp.]
MVQMLFFIRFKGQLRRTRPELIASLEGAVTKAASAAGGTTEAGRKVLTASFDEDRIGFWLDMVIFLERVHKALEKASRELYGYVLTLGRDVPEASVLSLYRSLSERDGRSTGILCSEEVCKALNYYMVFNSDRTLGSNSPQEGEEGPPEHYQELLKWRSFDGKGKRPPGRHYAELLRDTPPLEVRFGAAGCALVCFADAFTPLVRSFIVDIVPPDVMEELDAIHSLLFRERLRQEWSPYMIDRARSFIRALLAGYIATVKARSAHGALIMESLHLADSTAVNVFKEVYLSLGEEKELLVLAAGSSTEKSFKNWCDILNRVIINTQDEFPLPEVIDERQNTLPREILEISYNIFLLGRYFPDYLFPQLFEEEGLNRSTYFRTLTLLTSLGILTGGYSRAGIPDLAFDNEEALAASKGKIRRAVRKIILAWVGAGRLRPCFNLVRILSDLGERAEDDLILRSIKADVLNGTLEGIEKSMGKKSLFDSLVGAGNTPVLSYIYKTLKALAGGDKSDIQRAFQESVPSMTLEDNRPCYEAYQAQVQINLAAFYIGSRNSDAASEAVRKAMYLNRNLGKNAVPAHRLFSLVNLSRKRVDDAQEYISYALEQAERMEQGEEQVLTCYFASSISYLYGNLSKAERLAVRAEETALALGQSGWFLRPRLLRGRIKFELGQYEDALAVFEALDAAITAGTVHRSATMANTARAWISRTKVFLGRPPSDSGTVSSKARGASPIDEKLFEIEAAYFAADYEKAKKLADRFLSSPDTDTLESYSTELYYGKDFLFTEQPDWRSGFAQCENMLLNGKAPAARMAWIYQAMAQCALRPSREAKAEILGSMQRFMRDELLPDTDPTDAFFFYAWYCMLRNTGSAQVDMNTVVSIAYKRLQRRAARIDDIGAKQTFLTLPRWNNTLCLAAKEYKLT